MSNDRPPEAAAQPEGAPDQPAVNKLIYRSSELMAGRREIFIEHNRDLYRLRITSQGRLILTK